MVNSAILAAAAAGAFLASPASASLYLSSSPVIQVDAKNYESLIAKSNHTSIVEFYAPWCGHCKNLKPAYEKAAKNLAGLAKVAAVNCDEDENKPLCGQFGVKGFPTLKIVRPSKKAGKPTVEDYQGQRSTKAIVDAVIDKIPNHVKRVTDKQFEEFLTNDNETAKAILFTEKGTTSALLRAVAIDFLGSISIAQVRNTQKDAVETFGITSFPTLVLLPGGDKDGLVYEGEMKKDSIVAFLSKVAEPNPDPAPSESKKSSKKAKSSSKAAKPSKSQDAPKSSETVSEAADSTKSADADNLEEDMGPEVIIPEEPPTLQTLEYAPALEEACLDPKSHTCVLVLLPQKPLDNPVDAPLTEEAQTAISRLAQVQAGLEKRKVKLFPFYSIPNMNSAGLKLRRLFELNKIFKTEIVAINMKRNWWRHYDGDDFSIANLEDWIDRIRIGDAKKHKMPDALYPPEPEEEPIVIEPEQVSETTEETTEVPEEKVEKVEEPSHDEL